MVVVFPAPFGPKKPKTSPAWYGGTAKMFKSDAILGQNKVVIGWDKYFEIPMDALQDNSIQMKALSSGTIFLYSRKIDFERE
ncbi:DUF4879 domain-containing protein [Bacillus atrophaeus]|nr:DUF4879 domain-containing protein [Bacillus atrophaeus]